MVCGTESITAVEHEDKLRVVDRNWQRGVLKYNYEEGRTSAV